MIRRFAPLACALSLALASSAAFAQKSPQQQYQEDRAFCASAQAYQDRQACLKEAAQRGQLTQADYQRNALTRCERQPADARAACEARVRDQANVSGSVLGGGVIREHRETITLPATPAQ